MKLDLNAPIDSLSDEDKAALHDLLQDPVWRLCNLYQIKDKDGIIAPFNPSPEQCDIINEIHIYGTKRLIILKARQLGMSTVIDLIMADLMIWQEGFSGAVVDQNQTKASLKLTDIIMRAFDTMPPGLRDIFTVAKKNTEQFIIYQEPEDGSRDSIVYSDIFAATSSRGGTKQMLHVSEWGPIQHEDPKRSDEILTGSIPSAERGIIAVETTWMGGKHGNLWNLVQTAQETLPEHRTSRDFKLFFFPWYGDKGYVETGDFSQISAECHKYFDECEARIAELAARGIMKPHKFTPEQKLWYFKVALPMGDKRYSEYPTVLEECFMAPVPGAIYSKMIDGLRAAGRIADFPVSMAHPVFTYWDLGSPKNTRVLYFQFIGREIHIIDHDNLPLTPTERFAHMMAKGYNYAWHFLPHDAEAEEYMGDNYQQTLNKAGFTNLRIIPRCRTIWPGINHVIEISNRFVIHRNRCADFVSSMEIYRVKKSTVDGHLTDIIVQGDECHDVDPLRMMAESLLNKMLGDVGSAIDPEIRRGGHSRNLSRQTKASSGRYRGGR